nr:hypothetical protein PHYPA_013276 [Physcomitrium patens]
MLSSNVNDDTFFVPKVGMKLCVLLGDRFTVTTRWCGFLCRTVALEQSLLKLRSNRLTFHDGVVLLRRAPIEPPLQRCNAMFLHLHLHHTSTRECAEVRAVLCESCSQSIAGIAFLQSSFSGLFSGIVVV